MVQQWTLPGKPGLSEMRADRLPQFGGSQGGGAFKPQSLSQLPPVPNAEPSSVHQPNTSAALTSNAEHGRHPPSTRPSQQWASVD